LSAGGSAMSNAAADGSRTGQGVGQRSGAPVRPTTHARALSPSAAAKCDGKFRVTITGRFAGVKMTSEILEKEKACVKPFLITLTKKYMSASSLECQIRNILWRIH
jgi:hypothetical protein